MTTNEVGLASFNDAFGSGDLDRISGHVTDDVVFESTGPGPDGERYAGWEAVRRVWAELFAQTVEPEFTEEESFVVGDRAVVRWVYSWSEADGGRGHVRGVDVIRLREGKVAEKLSYVKG